MPQNIVEYTLKISDGGAKVELSKLSSSTKKLGKNLNTAEARYKKLQSRLKKLDKQLLKAAAGFAAFSFAVVKGLQGLKAFTMEAVDMINDLGDIGNRSGVAADTIGGLKAAFHASGQEASQVNQVLDVVAKKLGSLSRGSKAAEDAFKKYGIEIRNLNGDLRTNNDILLDSMHVIQGLADTSLRSRAAVELFGVGGQRLSQALGAGDFDKFLEFVNEFGAVAGPEAAKSAALVQDSVSLSNVAFEGFREELVLAVDLMSKLQTVLNATMGFFAGFKEVLKTSGGTLTALIDTLVAFGNEILSVINFIIGFGFGSLEKGIQGLVENFVLLGAAITRHFIKVLMVGLTGMIKFAALSDLVFGTKLTSSVLETQQAFSKLHETLDPKTNRGFLAFQSFQVGLAKSMKLFGEITKGAKHETELGNEALEETVEIVEEATEKFDALSASISLVSNAMSRLGIPKELTPDGMKELVETIMVLGQGLEQMGDERRLQASKFFKTDPNNVAQSIGKSIQSQAPAIGKAFAMFSGLKKIIDVAEKLGARGETVGEIQKSVQDEIKARAKAIELGLKALPPILFETLPPLLARFGLDLIIGLGGLFSQLIVRFVDGIKDLFKRDEKTREERGEAAIEFIKDFINAISLTGPAFKSGGPFIPSAKSGIRFTGAEEGLALLHRNEFVVPETGQAPQAVQRNLASQTSGGVVLNINAAVIEGNAVDALVREIERRFTTFGSSTSPLFGG